MNNPFNVLDWQDYLHSLALVPNKKVGIITRKLSLANSNYTLYTMCPRSSDPIYKVSYYMKWATTSLTDNTYLTYITQ